MNGQVINRSILLLLLLLLSALPCTTQTASPQWPKPVKKLVTTSRSVADIDFAKLELLQLQSSRHGPMPWAIKGQPSKATPYFVDPTIYGAEAIATVTFEAVDEQGALISVIPMIHHNDVTGRPLFLGAMIIPDRPFRVVVKGQAVDGQDYKFVYPSLFVPTSEPERWESLVPPRTNPNKAKKMRAAFADQAQQEYLKIKQQFEKYPGGIIVLPRSRVSNVNYTPLFSLSGAPRGLRITYDVEFSEDGYYNPELQVFPDYKNPEWRLKIVMKVINGSIQPEPIQESPQVQDHLLQFGAGYKYLGSTTYRFTAELIPDYIIHTDKGTKCISQKFNGDPQTLAAWTAILASWTPTTYRVSIPNSDFDGIIEDFYSQRVLYETFVAEGARDCLPHL